MKKAATTRKTGKSIVVLCNSVFVVLTVLLQVSISKAGSGDVADVAMEF